MKNKLILSRKYFIDSFEELCAFSNDVLNSSVNRKQYVKWLSISFSILTYIVLSYSLILAGEIYSIVTQSRLSWIGIVGLVNLFLVLVVIFYRFLPLSSGYYPGFEINVFNMVWPWVFPYKNSIYTVGIICSTLTDERNTELVKKAYENMKLYDCVVQDMLDEDWGRFNVYRAEWFMDYVLENNLSYKKSLRVINMIITLVEVYSDPEYFYYHKKIPHDLKPKKWMKINHNFFYNFSMSTIIFGLIMFPMSITAIVI